MNSPNDYRMTIVDLRIPFFRLVFFFVKAMLAMIPAAIILSVFFALLLVALRVLWRMLGGGGGFEALMRQLMM